MASLSFHVDHLATEEQPKAEAELRWMMQAARRKRVWLPRLVVVAVVAASFLAGMLWERGERNSVQLGAGAAALALFASWFLVKARRRRLFAQKWEMAVLRWHAARNLLKEAIRKHDARDAADQVKEEARHRAEIMDLLRSR